MKKNAIMAVLAAVVAPALARAEGASSTIDLTAVSSAGTSIQTALTSFFTTTLAPIVTAVGGAALAVYLIVVIFKWARKLGK